jgi:hypothetical protein
MPLLSRLLLLTSVSYFSILPSPVSGSLIEKAVEDTPITRRAIVAFPSQSSAGKPTQPTLVASSNLSTQWLQAQKPSPTPSASPQPSPSASTTTPASQPANNLPGWLLGIITFFVVAGGLSVFLLQRNFSNSMEAAADPSPHPSSRRNKAKPSSKKTARRSVHDSNGHNRLLTAATENKEDAVDVPRSDNGVPVGETTRLSKINIVDELSKELRNPDPAKRQKAIWELGQRGDTRSVQPLVDLMVDSDSRQRSLILAALSEIGTRTLKPLSRALAISLQDDNPEVRKNAIRDLTRVYDLVSQISQLLQHATEDPDNEVRETANWALSQLNRIRAVPGSNNLPMLQDAVSPPENLPGETRR